MITSATNQKLKDIQNLLKKSKARREEGVIVVEGLKMFIEVLTQFKERIKEAYMTEEAFNELNGKYESELKGIRYELVSEGAFAKISETVTPQGVMAIVDMPRYEISDLYIEGEARILILDDLRDPGNMGTIIRTAEAAGMTGILMSKETVDVTNPKVVRSTMGALLRMPLYYAESLVETINTLKGSIGLRVYVTELAASKPYNEVVYGDAFAVVIGNEAHGVSSEVLEVSDQNIIIPMAGKVESLNAAVAAAVVMFETRK